MDAKTTSFYGKAWFAWLMLFVFFPVGLFLLWKYSHHSAWVRGILSFSFTILLMVSVLTAYLSPAEKPVAKVVTNPKAAQQQKEMEENKAKKELEGKKKLEAKEYYNKARNESDPRSKEKLLTSIDLVNKALRIDPANPTYMDFKIHRLNDLKFFHGVNTSQEIIEIFETMQKNGFNPADSYFEIANAYESLGNYSKAEHCIDKAISLASPSSVSACWLSKANINHKQKKYNEELEALKKASETKEEYRFLYPAMHQFYKTIDNPREFDKLLATSRLARYLIGGELQQEVLLLKKAASDRKSVDVDQVPGIYKMVRAIAIGGRDPFERTNN